MFRIILILLELFLALTAFYGGGALMAKSDGSLLQMSTEWLQKTPFDNYFIPGLILALIVGGAAAIATVLLALRHSQARKSVLFSGLMLGGWISVQLLMVGFVSHLQSAYLALAMLLLLLGWQYKKPLTAE